MDASNPHPNGADFPLPQSAQAALLAQMEDNAEALFEDLMRTAPRFKEDGTTLAEAKGMTGEELESWYETGYGLFQEEAWRDALTVFTYLTAHDPFDIRFTFAAGMCFQQLDDALAATVAYAQALMLDSERADIAYRLGEALADIGQTPQARSVLTMALELIRDNVDRFHHLQTPTEELLLALAAASPAA
ncbi:tetratricopeptide repeat protein [Hydrogenophaga sp.]|uniref:tetratricopeptide repeat protein n=1 Tax=Hydrogenophaga sp. TaxID=1904254 RepID=UPI0027173969|nr:tetratricopeptide repeat protein [Hydrogenophaga sp.]MDO9436089.1 tetratricopeptide repeat protein [Hydrogenophaga sp.]